MNGIFLQRTLDTLKDIDKSKVFHEAVDVKEVPTYLDVIKNPMDFSKMQEKIKRMEYATFSHFEADFDLIINNCLLFNEKGDYFYKYAFKTREVVIFIFEKKYASLFSFKFKFSFSRLAAL